MSTPNFDMAAPPDVYRRRRAHLAAQLQRPVVIFAGHARPRNYAGNTYPFRAGSSYLYFGGPPIESAAWLIEPGSNGENGCTLLRPKPGFEIAVWFGELPSDEEIARVAGLPLGNLAKPDELTSLLKGRRAAAICPPCAITQEMARSAGLDSPTEQESLAIIDLRLIKDEHEVEAMRRAADIGIRAQLAAMRACEPGRNEADVTAAILAAYVAERAEPSFVPIVTVHGEVLHSERYVNPLEKGQLLLVDAGCEEPGRYASDMTRTFPVSGSFTPVQRHMYDTVLRAQQAAVAACVPGRRYREIHDLAARIICEGLVSAELLKGDPAELTTRSAHTLFFTHGLGHLIGLDVHDMEDFGDLAGYAPGRTRRTEFGNKFLRLDRDLETGYAVTIEPGVYLVPAIWREDALVRPFADVINRRKIEALLADQFGGIRIEDTVVVGDPDGRPENLTERLPKDADAVCAEIGRG